ncbi:MAG: CDP-2,3-bis-(O-geranylgeranyl)-sn-glycerol synthase [Methanolinea sp.]|nr:CDP-2,3-bis-(O-geranylgeranyl)-sn-glycerol synthase [Methanolinea sp.]
MLPAYVPNPVAAAFGGGRPIDGGMNFHDGRRIFGDGKTCRGFLCGVAAGILVGLVQIWGWNEAGLTWLPLHTLSSIVLLSFGALLGDLVKSFFKRRLGMKSGDKWLVADQYDLVLGAFLMVAIFDLPWLLANITIPVLLWIIVLTPVLHKTANVIGYMAGVKDVPW